MGRASSETEPGFSTLANRRLAEEDGRWGWVGGAGAAVDGGCLLTEPLEQLSGRAVTTLSVVVAYELTGFTAHCENNPSQAQLFDQHAAGGGGWGGGEANCVMFWH